MLHLTDIVIDNVVPALAGETVPAPVNIGQRWPVIRTGLRAPIKRDLRDMVHQRDGYRCRLCGKGKCLLQLDHIVPWSAGGPDTSANLRSVCQPCNKDRSNYRTRADLPVTPVTRACDPCIRGWIREHGYTRYGRIRPDEPALAAWCGNCRGPSTVTDPARLL